MRIWAVTRNIQFQIDLGEVVRRGLENFALMRRTIRLKKENEFLSLIDEQGLSYKEQLAYRKDQLAEEEKSNFKDESYIGELKRSISSLKRLTRFQKMRDDYFDSYAEFKEGKRSLSSVIDILEEQLNQNVTPEEYDIVIQRLRDAKVEKATMDTSVLTNRISLAKNDGTVRELEKLIDDVKGRIAKAEGGGNTEEADVWKIQMGILNKQLNIRKVENSLHDLDLRVDREGLKSEQKFELINDELNKANSDTPIVINNVRYNSAREFWSNFRNEYISGAGVGDFKDFFSDFEAELSRDLSSIASASQFGFIPVSKIDSIKDKYNTILSRNEFQQFREVGEARASEAIRTLVLKTARSVLDELDITGDISRAESALTALQSRFDVDLSSELVKTKDIALQLAEKRKRISGAAEVVAEEKGTTPEEEVGEFVESPLEPKVTEKVIKETKPEVKPAQPVQPPQPPQQDFLNITVEKGDTLSALSLKHLGSAQRFKEIAELNKLTDPNKISVGQQLKIPKK